MEKLSACRFASAKKYHCVTNKGQWDFFAMDDLEAYRLALYFSWRDDEHVLRVEYNGPGPRYTLQIVKCSNHKISTL